MSSKFYRIYIFRIIQPILEVEKSRSKLKVAFFQKVRFIFQISKSPKKITPNHYPELEIWISCLLLWAEISNFKFRIVIWSNLFWRFEKRISLSEKKPPLLEIFQDCNLKWIVFRFGIWNVCGLWSPIFVRVYATKNQDECNLNFFKVGDKPMFQNQNDGCRLNPWLLCNAADAFQTNLAT